MSLLRASTNATPQWDDFYYHRLKDPGFIDMKNKTFEKIDSLCVQTIIHLSQMASHKEMGQLAVISPSSTLVGCLSDILGPHRCKRCRNTQEEQPVIGRSSVTTKCKFILNTSAFHWSLYLGKERLQDEMLHSLIPLSQAY